jgi:hypothetical protein
VRHTLITRRQKSKATPRREHWRVSARSAACSRSSPIRDNLRNFLLSPMTQFLSTIDIGVNVSTRRRVPTRNDRIWIPLSIAARNQECGDLRDGSFRYCFRPPCETRPTVSRTLSASQDQTQWLASSTFLYLTKYLKKKPKRKLIPPIISRVKNGKCQANQDATL